MVEVNLEFIRRPNVSLADAIEDCVMQDAIGLYQSMSAYVIGSGASRPECVYEARLFTESSELRWLRDPSKSGDVGAAVLVGEAPRSIDGWLALPTLRNLAMIPARYVLWGMVQARHAGWGLAEGRIPSIGLPGSHWVQGSRVELRSIEYVACDEHGNARVIEERFVGLGVCSGVAMNEEVQHA